MSHKCGPGCHRKQNPSTKKECATCNMALERAREKAKRRRYARRVIANPTRHYDPYSAFPGTNRMDRENNNSEPYHQGRDNDDDVSRMIYFGKVPEVNKWLRVVVENDQLLTAYFDRRLIRRWGKP